MTMITTTTTARISVGELDRLEAEIVEVAAGMAAWRVRLLALVGEFDARGGWVGSGAVSCARWLADLLDVEVSTAREHVRVARALRELPAIRAGFEKGSLSYAKVRHLTRVATPGSEEELVGLAHEHAAGELAAVLAAWQQRQGPLTPAAAAASRDDRGVSARTVPSGNRVITIELPPEARRPAGPAGDPGRGAWLRPRAPPIPGRRWRSSPPTPWCASSRPRCRVGARPRTRRGPW
ncbi:MAG: DUF222 domain-containing protein [Acidimicrobiia bacterium]|nr:DUF222 domain-containing protein [Acidimicrobiia bacterium]